MVIFTYNINIIVLLKNDGDSCSESDQEKITTQELANGLLPRFTMKTTLESLEDNRCRFTNQEYVTVNITRIGEIRIICGGIFSDFERHGFVYDQCGNSIIR